MKYGEAGLEVAIARLKDKSPRVRQRVIDLLEQRERELKVKAAIAIYRSDITNLIVDIIVSSEDGSLKMAARHSTLKIF